MPPRKKARTTPSSVTSPTTYPSTPAAAPSTPLPILSTLKQPTATSTSALASPSTSPNDPWTPAQETDLFKALIRYKPTGIHKHFHMLSISSFLRSHGHCLLPPPISSSLSLSKGLATTGGLSAEDAFDTEPLQPHTRIPGIWARLQTLYDLDALDEREDTNTIGPPEQAIEDWDPNGRSTREFMLPEDTDADFNQLMWRRRWRGENGSKRDAQRDEEAKNPEADVSSSPPSMEIMRGRDGIVISEDEVSPVRGKGRKARERPKPTPVATPAAIPVTTQKQGRTRGGAVRGARVSTAVPEPEPEASPSSESKAEEEPSAGDEEEEEGSASASAAVSGSGEEADSASEEGSEESKEGEEQGSEEPEEEEEVEAPTPPVRGTRSKAVSRGRGSGKRGRGRGARK